MIYETLAFPLSYVRIFSLFNFILFNMVSEHGFMERGLILNTAFIFPSVSAIWYLCFVSANLVFVLPFSFFNLVFVFYFCNFLWSDHITLRIYLFSFCDICSISAIRYFVLCFLFVLVFLCLLIMANEKDDFASVCECEVGWKEPFILELCNEKKF